MIYHIVYNSCQLTLINFFLGSLAYFLLTYFSDDFSQEVFFQLIVFAAKLMFIWLIRFPQKKNISTVYEIQYP